MDWPLQKIYEYLAFYRTQNDEFIAEYKESMLTPAQKQQRILKLLGG